MKEGWESRKLGEISKIMYGHTAKTNSSLSGIKYLRITDIQNGSVDWNNVPTCPILDDFQKYELKYGDIVFARTGATTGKSYLIKSPPKAVFASYLIRVQIEKEKLLPEFLYLFFQSNAYWKVVEAGISGSAQGGFNAKKLGNLEIPIPPLPEQKQIVVLLDKAFATVNQAQANIEKNIENTKELFQSKLNAIFSQKDEGDALSMSKGWEEKSLGEVCEYDKTKYADGNLPYVGLEHIESNTGKFIGNLEPFQVKSSTFQFDERHVLYGRLRPYLNKVLVPNFKGHCSTEIFPILTNDSLDRGFLFYWFLAPKTVSKIDATWTGARMPRANMNEVIKFKLFIPNIQTQKQIVNQLNDLKSETEAIESHYQKKLDNLEDLKKSILQKAFSGELTQKPVAV